MQDVGCTRPGHGRGAGRLCSPLPGSCLVISLLSPGSTFLPTHCLFIPTSHSCLSESGRESPLRAFSLLFCKPAGWIWAISEVSGPSGLFVLVCLIWMFLGALGIVQTPSGPITGLWDVKHSGGIAVMGANLGSCRGDGAPLTLLLCVLLLFSLTSGTQASSVQVSASWTATVLSQTHKREVLVSC